jgi:hypothetical protein
MIMPITPTKVASAIIAGKFAIAEKRDELTK